MTQRLKKNSPSYESQPFAGVVVFDPTEKAVRIRMNAPQLYQHFLNKVCKVGDNVTMYITNKRPKRSLQLNNYYHLYISLISLSSGHSPAELKAWAKGKFLTKGISEVFGHKTRVVKSTSDLNTAEFLEFLEELELSTGIPLPDSQPFTYPLTTKEYNALKSKQQKFYKRLSAKIIINKKN